MNWLQQLFHRPLRHPLDPTDPTIILPANLENRYYAKTARLALDTGASYCVITPAVAAHLHLPPAKKTLEVATAQGLQAVPLTTLPHLTVLGQDRQTVPTLIMDLPPESYIDGLLGLSFLRHFQLHLNFPQSYLTISQ